MDVMLSLFPEVNIQQCVDIVLKLPCIREVISFFGILISNITQRQEPGILKRLLPISFEAGRIFQSQKNSAALFSNGVFLALKTVRQINVDPLEQVSQQSF